jgi:hypothetical protein
MSSATSWATINVECAVIGRRSGWYVPLGFESTFGDPEEMLPNVARTIGMSEPGPSWLDGRVVLRTQHILAGNPSRTGPRERIVSLPSDKRSLSTFESGVVSLITAPTRWALSHLPKEKRGG